MILPAKFTPGVEPELTPNQIPLKTRKLPTTDTEILEDSIAPVRAVRRVVDSFQAFTRAQTSGGIVLLAAAAVALAWANSPWSDIYFRTWETKLTIGTPTFGITESVGHWINDGLMALFFFVVGLEIKREVLIGELASIRQAMLPLAAAVGGMVVPALLYASINSGGAGSAGWGIPMATDIAFALGILALLGSRVPVALKVFLAALAIVDDIGAVLVIAVFYTTDVDWLSLAVAATTVGALITINRARIRHPGAYAVLGVILWIAFLHSGIHATVAGVVLAMTIPARTRINESEFAAEIRENLAQFESACGTGEELLSNSQQQDAVENMENACEGAQSPLMKLEHTLHGFVAFFVMPLFALANAGIAIGFGNEMSGSASITAGVALGLLLGKPLGIMLAAWIVVRVGAAVLPDGVTWRMIHGTAWLAGIGFTMALFIAGLAFPTGQLLEGAKLGTIGASLLGGTIGWTLLRRATAPTEQSADSG